MTTTIETVFENGVFRPVLPIALPERHRVRITLDQPEVTAGSASDYPRLEPRPYPDDVPTFPDSDYEYVPMPPKAVRTVTAHVVFAGKLLPAPYPDE